MNCSGRRLPVSRDEGLLRASAGAQVAQLIASQAIPTLNTEAVAAQSAAISMVSHATYTSQAYAQSLQAAIDQAFGA